MITINHSDNNNNKVIKWQGEEYTWVLTLLEEEERRGTRDPSSRWLRWWLATGNLKRAEAPWWVEQVRVIECTQARRGLISVLVLTLLREGWLWWEKVESNRVEVVVEVVVRRRMVKKKRRGEEERERDKESTQWDEIKWMMVPSLQESDPDGEASTTEPRYRLALRREKKKV
jgi:hypothetical protein